MATSTGKKVKKTYFRAAEGARRRGSTVLESWRHGGGAKMKGREGDGEEHCSKSWRVTVLSRALVLRVEQSAL